MVCMLWSLLGTRPGHEYVFSYAGTPAARAARLTAMFGSALRELGVPYGVAHGYVLSSLRAGAITTLYQRCGDLQRVRWYGRWDSLRTMEITCRSCRKPPSSPSWTRRRAPNWLRLLVCSSN